MPWLAVLEGVPCKVGGKFRLNSDSDTWGGGEYMVRYKLTRGWVSETPKVVLYGYFKCGGVRSKFLLR